MSASSVKLKKFQLACITGATSGIGMKLAYALAAQGIPLLIAGRNREKLEELKRELSSRVPIDIFQGDLADATRRTELITLIEKHKPDLTINNAGAGLYGDVISHSNGTSLQLFRLNAEAVLELTIAAVRALKDAGHAGVIVNVSSVAAFPIFPGFAVYSSSKAFVNHFSRSLDFEMAEHGIRVLTSCPGMVDTSFAANAGTRQDRLPKPSESMSVDFAVQEILTQIANEQSLRIFNWKYRLGAFLTKLIPAVIYTPFLRKNVNSRVGKE